MEVSTVVSFLAFAVLPGWSLLRLVASEWDLDWVEWGVLSVVLSLCVSVGALFILFSLGIPLQPTSLYIAVSAFSFCLELIREIRGRVDK